MNRLLLVNYHYIRDPDAIAHPGIHPISLRDFTDQVDLLLRKLHPASPEEVADFAKGRDRLPGPSFFLTLDDGLMDHLEAAREVLRPRGLRVAFFVCSRPLTERLAISVHKVHWLRAMTPPVDFRDEFLSQLPTEWRAAEGDAELAQAAADTNQYDPPEIARLKYLINFHLPYDVVDRVTSAMLAGRGVSEAGFCGDFYMDGGDLGELAGDGHVIGAHSH
ncbi:MAG: hypothetical protein QF491_01070, partial [Alphaproteobacteria bacterium]|nr:hypothetical protein [Alphaproteobacteria bacterium]